MKINNEIQNYQDYNNIIMLFSSKPKRLILDGIQFQDFKQVLGKYDFDELVHLEINNFDELEQFNFLEKCKNLKTLALRNCYVHTDNFYENAVKLKSLENLTFNHYTYFSENPKFRFDTKEKFFSSLKAFTMEFPDQSDVQLDFKYDVIRNKYNSLSFIKNFEIGFPYLDVIYLKNYQHYLDPIYQGDYGYDDDKDISKHAFFGLLFDQLVKLPKLKDIIINSGHVSELFKGSIFKHISNYIDRYNFNNLSKRTLQNIIQGKILNINYKADNINFSISEDEQYIQINPFVFPKFFFSKANKVSNIFKQGIEQQYETIVFSPFHNITKSAGFSNDWKSEKDKIYKFLNTQQRLNHIIIDLNEEGIFKDKIKEELDKSYIIGLVYFLHNLLLNYSNIKITIKHQEFKNLINNITKNEFLIDHGAYLFNFYYNLNQKFQSRIYFENINLDEINNYLKNFYFQECSQVYIIHDPIYDHCLEFSNVDLIYNDEFGYRSYQHYINFKNINDKKNKRAFKSVYSDLIRITTGSSFELDDSNKSKPIAIVKSSFLRDQKYTVFSKVKKIWFYFGHIHHAIFHAISTKDRWKYIEQIKKQYQNKDHKNLNFDQLSSQHLIQEVVKNGKYKSDTKLQDLLKGKFLDQKEFTKEFFSNIEFDNLDHVHFEGVNPWLGTFCDLRLDELFPKNKITTLIANDCLKGELSIPKIYYLKKIELGFYINQQNALNENKVYNFAQLKNIEEIKINRVFNNYHNSLIDDYGMANTFNVNYDDGFDDDISLGVTKVDLSEIHLCSFLKKLHINQIIHSDLKTIPINENVGEVNISPVHLSLRHILSENDLERDMGFLGDICDEKQLESIEENKKNEITNLSWDIPFFIYDEVFLFYRNNLNKKNIDEKIQSHFDKILNGKVADSSIHLFNSIKNFKKEHKFYKYNISNFDKDYKEFVQQVIQEVKNFIYKNPNIELTNATNDESLKFLGNFKKLEKLTLNLGNKPYSDGFFSNDDNPFNLHYCGNGDFLNHLNHNLKELNLNVPILEAQEHVASDILRKICNRFLKLEKLRFSFFKPVGGLSYGDYEKYFENIDKTKTSYVEIDVALISKLKNLTVIEFEVANKYIHYKIKNFDQMTKLQKIKHFGIDIDIDGIIVSIPEVKKAITFFDNENYKNMSYLDEYYDEEDYINKKWSRADFINFCPYEWKSLRHLLKNLEEQKSGKKKND